MDNFNINQVTKMVKPDPTMALGAVKEMHNSVLEYLRIRQQEMTKREGIRAKRDCFIAEISAKKEIFMDFINKTYGEREKIYSSLFSTLGKGIEKNDSKLIEMAMSGIITQMKVSPFESFSDFAKSLNDPNATFEL